MKALGNFEVDVEGIARVSEVLPGRSNALKGAVC